MQTLQSDFDGYSNEGRNTLLSETSDVSGEDETPLSMHLFETFRNKLFYYPFDEASEEKIKEVLESPNFGMAILFSFLTYVH